MQLNEMIAELVDRRAVLDRAIAALEGVQQRPVKRSPRGRKFMGPEERKEVSDRMKRFWAKQRGQSK